ncbi:MAG: Asp-tRNA(Asn)/Glu-tRNA(Gln) amidotransferase subunit GatB [Rhabdochlamydiaceae bacterium]
MTQPLLTEWQPVIGLEIHVQLNTKSKLFSSSANRFGDEPNTNIGIVCTGQPGALPVLNKEAVQKAVSFGCAVQAHIAPVSRFDRKSYFYPDSPRNFQITQFEHPIIIGGRVYCEVNGQERIFYINRAHLEDDAGMLKHFTNFAGVDYNRAGVPLLEIVSEPCFHSPEEAVAYAQQIKSIMEFIDASDCNMEEGSLRIDANISVRPKGDLKLRKKVEIKNMNSFYNMSLALQAEIERQIKAYNAHPSEDPEKVILGGTYRFDLEKKQTVLMRTKENAADYRYFPEPDLPPIVLTPTYIKAIQETLPELPYERLKRYRDILGFSHETASFLISDKKLSDYFQTGLQETSNAKSLCNWIIVEFLGRLKDSGQSVYESGVSAQHIGQLVQMIDEGTITGKIAKLVADEMLKHPGLSPENIVKSNPDYQPIHDLSFLEPIIEKIVQENPESVKDYLSGRTKALAYLVGQVMKASQGKASPSLVNHLIIKAIEIRAN